MLQSNHDGSERITVVRYDPVLPPAKLSFTLAGAGRMLWEAHEIITRSSLPVKRAVVQGGNHVAVGNHGGVDSD